MVATEPASRQDVFRNGAGQAAKQVEYATGASSSRLVAAGQGSRLTRQDMMTYPILEHDPTPQAKIEPSKVITPRDMPEHSVACFFKDVIDKVVTERQAKVLSQNRWEDGPHPVYEIEHKGKRLAFFQPGIGSSQAVAILEEVIAFGCRKFVACGGCGVLEPDMAAGHLIVVSSAVRDEGTSYHYLPPSREVQANSVVLNSLTESLTGRRVPHIVGKTWTTDAPYRETVDAIARRRAEGCVVVEMEAAGMMAVSQFRDVIFGQVLYAGDDLSGPEWDRRDWQSLAEVRESLFWLCADSVLSL